MPEWYDVITLTEEDVTGTLSEDSDKHGDESQNEWDQEENVRIQKAVSSFDIYADW